MFFRVTSRAKPFHIQWDAVVWVMSVGFAFFPARAACFRPFQESHPNRSTNQESRSPHALIFLIVLFGILFDLFTISNFPRLHRAQLSFCENSLIGFSFQPKALLTPSAAISLRVSELLAKRRKQFHFTAHRAGLRPFSFSAYHQVVHYYGKPSFSLRSGLWHWLSRLAFQGQPRAGF